MFYPSPPPRGRTLISLKENLISVRKGEGGGGMLPDLMQKKFTKKNQINFLSVLLGGYTQFLQYIRREIQRKVMRRTEGSFRTYGS